MNLSQIDILAAGAGVLAVWMCGLIHLRGQLLALSLQTTLLAGIVALLRVGRPPSEHLVILALAVFVIKGIAVPLFLMWSAHRLGVTRDTGASCPTITLLLGCAGLGVGYFLGPDFAVTKLGNGGTAGIALTLLLIGMLLMMTRRLAISQLIGFLVLENGIFLYGLTQTLGMPMFFEMGIVLEVTGAVLIAGLVMFRMDRSFEHIDVAHLRGLRY